MRNQPSIGFVLLVMRATGGGPATGGASSVIRNRDRKDSGAKRRVRGGARPTVAVASSLWWAWDWDWDGVCVLGRREQMQRQFQGTPGEAIIMVAC